MRSKVTWTITNQANRTLSYGLYLESDTVNRLVLDNQYGEIEAGHSVDVDVSQARLKIRFWKSLPTMGFGGEAFTDGVAVDTDATVFISDDAKVTQGKRSEYSLKPSANR